MTARNGRKRVNPAQALRTWKRSMPMNTKSTVERVFQFIGKWPRRKSKPWRPEPKGSGALSEVRLSPPFVKDLEAPLLKLGRQTFFTLRDACSGVHVFGAIGSGKTTGAGGIITVAKPEDILLWKHYAEKHGRSDSLIFFDEHECFNFLDYELARQGMDGIGSVVEFIMRIIEAARHASSTGSSRGGDVFWSDSGREGLRYAIPMIYAAQGSLSIADIIRFITTAPTHVSMPTNPEWQARSFMYKIANQALNTPKVPMTRAAAENAIRYWSERWPAVPDKTRGNIVATITTALDRFMHGRLQRAFCGRTTLVPELTFHGAIIVLAMPTLTWNEDGIIAQQLFKFAWQRAVLSRNSLAEEHRERPVFAFSDEAQETVNSFDFEYQSLCRASKACTVYMTQSLPTYYAKIGGDNPRDAAHALVGKFATNIFHSNACPDTNEYASRVIGKVITRRGTASTGTSRSVSRGMSVGSSETSSFSYSSGASGDQGNYSASDSVSFGRNWSENRGRSTGESTSQGYTESMENLIEPGDFARDLKCGGAENGKIVTGVWFQAGRAFKASATNALYVRFKQS